MSTSAEIAKQNLNFAKALSTGQITQAQYDSAMAHQAQLNKPNETANPPPTTQTQVMQQNVNTIQQNNQEITATNNAIIQEGYKVQALPSTNEEALAVGAPSYLPEAEKQIFYDQIKEAYLKNQTSIQQNTLNIDTLKQNIQQNQLPVNPIPINPSTPIIQDATGLWAIKGSTVTPITEHNPDNPLNPTVVGYEITPPATPQQEQKPPQSIGEQIANFNPAKFGAQIGADIFSAITGKDVPQQKVDQFGNDVSKIMGSGIPGIQGTPTEFVGGMVASVESTVYSVGTLIGVKDLPRPPTASGALLTSGWDSIVNGKPTASQELNELNAKGPAYAAGSIAGDIIQTVVAGKAVGEATKFVAERGIPYLSRGAQIMGGLNSLGVPQQTFKATMGRVATNIGAQTGIGYALGGTQGAVQGAIFGTVFSGASELGGRFGSIQNKLPDWNDVRFGLRDIKNDFLNRFFPDWHEPITIRDYPPRGSPGWGGKVDWNDYSYSGSSTTQRNAYQIAALDNVSYNKVSALTTTMDRNMPALPDRYIPTPETPTVFNYPTYKPSFEPPSKSFTYKPTANPQEELNSWGFQKHPTNFATETTPEFLAQPMTETPEPLHKQTAYANPNQFADAEKLFRTSQLNKGSIVPQPYEELNSWGYPKHARTFTTDLASNQRTPLEANQQKSELNSWGYPKHSTQQYISTRVVTQPFAQPQASTNLATSQTRRQPTTTIDLFDTTKPTYRNNLFPLITTRPEPSPVQKPSPFISNNPQPKPQPIQDPFTDPTYERYPPRKPPVIPPFGSKGMEFGGNKQDFPNFTGLRSVKRQYDILTAEEFMGI